MTRTSPGRGGSSGGAGGAEDFENVLDIGGRGVLGVEMCI